MVYNPYEQRREKRVLYGASGEPLEYIGPREEPAVESPTEEGAFEELFEAQAEVGLGLAELESQAREEERKKIELAKLQELKAKREEKLVKGEYELKTAQQREALRKTGETAWGRASRYAGRTRQVVKGAGGVASTLHKVATLGGETKRPMREIRELYIPSRGKLGVAPEQAARQISPGEIGAPLRALNVIPLDAMRSRTAGVGGTLIAQVARSSIMGGRQMGGPRVASESALARLRGLTFPRGLSKQEQAAYLEIRQNHDIDIPTHVIDELGRLGISRQEALSAIKSLISKGHIVKGGEFSGEPVLEVTR